MQKCGGYQAPYLPGKNAFAQRQKTLWTYGLKGQPRDQYMTHWEGDAQAAEHTQDDDHQRHGRMPGCQLTRCLRFRKRIRQLQLAAEIVIYQFIERGYRLRITHKHHLFAMFFGDAMLKAARAQEFAQGCEV